MTGTKSQMKYPNTSCENDPSSQDKDEEQKKQLHDISKQLLFVKLDPIYEMNMGNYFKLKLNLDATDD